MTEEFNLSKKREQMGRFLLECNWAKETVKAILELVEKDDKKFIEKLKEKSALYKSAMDLGEDTFTITRKDLDKLVGGKKENETDKIFL